VDPALQLATITATLLAAVLGGAGVYIDGRARATRAARLDRVSAQLRLLYGPLFATLLSNDAAWDAFEANYWPGHNKRFYFPKRARVTKEERARWVTWMREVFQPANERMERIIIDHLDLIEGGEMPAAFSDLLAHNAAYRAVLSQWAEGDYSEYASVLNFSSEDLMAEIKPVYTELLKRQRQLIDGTV
jgi:hypothetical protein